MENKKDINKAERQIYILSLLSENPKGYTADEIQQRLKQWDIDVSRRTVTRDIDELSVNYAIMEDERGGKEYFYADKYTLRNVDLTIQDIASLAFAKEMMKGYKQYTLGNHAVDLIEKMVSSSNALNKLQFESLCKQFVQVNVGDSQKDVVDSGNEQQVRVAIDNHKKIKIGYYSFSSDEVSQRVIHPFRMLVLDNYLSVEGYCELRKEVRRFRLSRINEIEILDDKFDAKELTMYGNQPGFLKLAGQMPEQIELVFTGNAIRYVKEYESVRASKLEELEDGLHFYQEAPIGPDVIRWVRGFGSEVNVISPSWLQEQLIREAKERLEGK